MIILVIEEDAQVQRIFGSLLKLKHISLVFTVFAGLLLLEGKGFGCEVNREEYGIP